jgi:transcriptional regulator with XRE-family HTH domain
MPQNKLSEIRRSKGETLLDMQSKTGISVAHLSDIERGKALPGLPLIGRLAGAYGISAEEVIAILSAGQVKLEQESFTIIKTVENGACDLIRLDYFKEYAPGYRIMVETGRGLIKEKHCIMYYWLHEIEQAIKLFNALSDVSVSEVEK